MDTSKIFEELRLNLYHRFIFYIPSSLLSELERKKIPEELKVGFYDRIAIIMEDGRINSEMYGQYLYQVLEKFKYLQQNLFKLVDLEVCLNEKQFKSVIEEYSKQLKMYHWLAELLNNNLVKNFPNIDSGTKSTFGFQLLAFEDHLKIFETKFNQINLKTPSKTLKIETKVSNTQQIVETQSTEKRVEGELKKPKDITDEEIDAYLLQSVFGIGKEYFK